MMKKFLIFLLITMFLATGAIAGAVSSKAVTIGGDTPYYLIYDEDAMGSDSASGLPTQQSVKAYVDDAFQLQLPVVSAFIDGTGVIGNDGTTAPGVAETDNIPKIVWADNEVTPVQWTFSVPSNLLTTWQVNLLHSTSDDTTPSQIDWQLWLNNDGVTHDAAAIAQTVVTASTGQTTGEMLTLIPDATAVSALTTCGAGCSITLDIWNTTVGGGTNEIGNVYIDIQ